MNNKSHTVSQLSRVLLWTAAVLLIIVALVRLSLKTAPVHNWVKGIVVSVANEQLRGEIEIDNLSGDLWQEVEISGLRLIRDDTLLQVDSIHARYKIWPLLKSDIQIPELGIYGPRLALYQQDGKWNFEDLTTDTSETESSYSFRIEELFLSRGQLSVHSENLPLESDFSISQLTILSSLGYDNDDFDANIEDLSFELSRVDWDTIKVQTAASVDSQRVTLEKLVLATGNSLVKSSGFFQQDDTTLSLNLSASPISWRDISSYAADFPVREDVQVSIGLSGTPDRFNFSLDMQANGLQDLSAKAQFQWDTGLILRQFQFGLVQFHPEPLMGDTTLPSFQNMDINFAGRVNIQDYKEGQGNVEFSVEDLDQNNYRLDTVTGNGQLENQSANLELKTQTDEQLLTADLKAQNIYSERPVVQALLAGQNINPAYWTGDSSYSAALSFRSEVTGRGWVPDTEQWDYSFSLTDGYFGDYPIESFYAEGEASLQQINMSSELVLEQGRFTLAADLKHLDAVPSYSYRLKTRDFDPAGLMDLDFTTLINAEFRGHGRGIDPASMELTTSINVDSSLVNGERLDEFSGEFRLRDSVATVDSAQLRSTIADGLINGRVNLLRRYDSDNWLDVDVMLKDMQPLAPLANAKELNLEGTITGTLRPVADEKLQFKSDLNLTGITYDDFTTASTTGSLEANIKDSLEYMVDLYIESPAFGEFKLQDFEASTEGKYTDTEISGKNSIRFSSPTEGSIKQAGQYSIVNDSVTVTTNRLDIISGERTLSLERPFAFKMKDEIMQLDTMRVSSVDGAFLEIGAPLISSQKQQAHMEADSLNMSVIQSLIIDDTYVGGTLSGQLSIDRRDTSIVADGRLLISELNYEDALFDSLLVTGGVEDERFEGNMILRNENQNLVEGELNLPFALKDPEELPEKFLEEQIQGTLFIHNSDIEQFHPFLGEELKETTTGILSLKTELKGRVGQPEFVGDMVLKEARLSSVPMDSIIVDADYSHSASKLNMTASLLSMQQKAAEMRAQIPLSIDTRTFDIRFLEEQDSITAEVISNDFNLAALNDFVDPSMYRSIEGRLNGKIEVSGVRDNLKTNGELVLFDGGLQLVPAGIRLDEIGAKVEISPDQILLSELTAGSGRGDLDARGVVEHDNLSPGGLDFQLVADNFRAANTSLYNAVLNADIQVQGTVEQPQINGSVGFLSGFIELENFGEEAVEQVELDSEDVSNDTVSVYDSLGLDMDISFNRRFFIRNERYLEMEIELEGKVNLAKKSGEDLQLFGTMNAADGYARPLGKLFDLQEGAITFTGDPANPQMNVRTRYEPPQAQEEVVIWYVIEGTVENPEFIYESEPPMELENIISYTLFGQPFYALDSWKQAVASSGSNTTAADLALDVLMDRVESLATRQLGIDVVRIDNTRTGGESGTAITTGWYLSPRVFFAIQNIIAGSSPETNFLLEYNLKRNLKLLLRQGENIRQGVDLEWNYDY